MIITAPLFRTTATGTFPGLFTMRTLPDGRTVAARVTRAEPRRLRRPGPNAAFRAALALHASTPTVRPIQPQAWLAMALTIADQPPPAILTPYPVCIPNATSLALAYAR
jgi:hypothetical protein